MNEGPALNEVTAEWGDGGSKKQSQDSAVTSSSRDTVGGHTEETSRIQPGPSGSSRDVTADLDL